MASIARLICYFDVHLRLIEKAAWCIAALPSNLFLRLWWENIGKIGRVLRDARLDRLRGLHILDSFVELICFLLYRLIFIDFHDS